MRIAESRKRFVMDTLLLIGLLALQLICVFLVIMGLPGQLFSVSFAAGYLFLSHNPVIGWPTILIFGVIGISAEAIEFLGGYFGARKFGKSSKYAAWGAFWGGLAAGVLGTFVIPVIGTIFGSFAGTFLGALLVEGKNEPRKGIRAGMGALLGRVIGLSVKVGTALAFLLYTVLKIVFPGGMPDIFSGVGQ